MKPCFWASAFLAVAACGGETPAGADRPSSDHRAAAEAHWTYRDQAHWSEQSGAGACSAGARQSPVDLQEETLIDEPDVAFRYSPGEGAIFNNGHAIEIEAPAGQVMRRAGETYTLLQAHFHDPGEHHLRGETFPMELHLVHRRPDDGLAVVGVLIREGAANAALAPLWSAVPAQTGKEHAAKVTFDAAALLPRDPIHFEYAGSLTTPPCTEGVRWFVMRAPIEASAGQIAFLRTRIGENARAIQPLNDRDVTEGE
jgi:carbonic anhydrase